MTSRGFFFRFAAMDMLFFFLGFAVGMLGTLIGAGGGFLLTPVFLFMFPEMRPTHLTALSLLAVAANSTSGSLGYAYRKQVHWPSVLYFTAAAIPGVFIGVRIVEFIPREKFEVLFAALLVFLSCFVLWRSFRPKPQISESQPFWNFSTKMIGSGISFFIGIISSLFGIGGGIIHVPLLSEFLRYPIHLAAGTSHAILAITSMVAVFHHLQSGDLNPLETFVPYLIVGLVLGAQGGAMFSKKIKSSWILRGLGLGLLIVAVRLIGKALF